MKTQANSGSMAGNILLNALSSECRDFLAERMLTKPIISGEVLYEADAPLLNLIFPYEGVVSMQCSLKDGRTVERISVGRDGFVGMEFLLGEIRITSLAVTVISGRAAWIPVQAVKEAMKKFPGTEEIIKSYVVVIVRRVMQSVVCASVHSASQRISSWLLHAYDRTQVSSFDITQKTIAGIFGLRLATVSDACSRLQAAGAIDHSRGSLTIIDRDALEAQACECYELLNAQLKR